MLPAKAAEYVSKLDKMTVKVSPATKPSPVPVAFMDMMVDGKKLDSKMFVFPGFLRIPMKDGLVQFNKHYLKPAGPDVCHHPSAEKFLREFEDFREFAKGIQDKIKTAVAENPLELFKKPVDPACITVVDIVEVSDEYGCSVPVKMDLVDKSKTQDFSLENLDVALMDVNRTEKGVEMTPLTFGSLSSGDILAVVTKGPYLTLMTEKNKLDGKTIGIVRVNWTVNFAYRVGKNGKRTRDTATEPVDWASDAAKEVMGDYV